MFPITMFPFTVSGFLSIYFAINGEKNIIVIPRASLYRGSSNRGLYVQNLAHTSDNSCK